MLFAFDLDETIVPNHQPVSQTILDELERIKTLGHHVAVITGRTEKSAAPYVQQVQPNTAAAYAQGAHIVENGVVLQETTLSTQTVQTLMAHSIAQGALFYAASPHGFFVLDTENPRWQWVKDEGNALRSYTEYTNQAIWKMVFVHHDSDFHDQIKNLTPHHNHYPWNEGFLEVTHPEAHKGAALALIAKRLGIAQHEVVAFGDGSNDFTMLEWAGHGVAVGTTSETAKAKVGNEVISSVDAVADWLKTNVG